MPELPEIETARQRLQKALKGHAIATVWVDKDDHICFDEAAPAQVAKALRGARVTGTGRKGKYFWLELNRKPWVILHFGMTGNLEIRRPKKKGAAEPEPGWGGLTLWHNRNQKPVVDLSKPPRFCRLLIGLENGTQIAITDPRRFGRIRLSDDPATSGPISRLGFDPLQDFPSAKILGERLSRRKMAIKAVLLDQTLFAGVGNWIADEVLYQAAIAPHRIAAELNPAEVSLLRRKLVSIIRTAVDVEADYGSYPKGWLFHYRWGKVKDAQDHRGRAILHEDIGGRTTAWVPAVQWKTQAQPAPATFSAEK